ERLAIESSSSRAEVRRRSPAGRRAFQSKLSSCATPSSDSCPSGSCGAKERATAASSGSGTDSTRPCALSASDATSRLALTPAAELEPAPIEAEAAAHGMGLRGIAAHLHAQVQALAETRRQQELHVRVPELSETAQLRVLHTHREGQRARHRPMERPALELD